MHKEIPSMCSSKDKHFEEHLGWLGLLSLHSSMITICSLHSTPVPNAVCCPEPKQLHTHFHFLFFFLFFFLQKHLRKLFASSKHENNNPEMEKQKVTFTCRNSRTARRDSNSSTQEEADHHTDGTLDNAAGDYLKEKCSSYHTTYKNTTSPFNLRLGRKTHWENRFNPEG